jgi:hypothetical protein
MAIDNDFMRPYLHRKWCWDNGYFVDIIPIKKGRSQSFCKIHLRLQKNIKEGDDEYRQGTERLAQKIDELYTYMYRNFK